MIKIRGNYLWWAGANLLTGILLAILGWVLADMKPVFVMAIVLIPFGAFNFWFIKGTKSDEREVQIINKIFAKSGLVIFTTAWVLAAFNNPFGVYPILGVAFASRGVYGFRYFLEDR
ncbi:MAG: hypothetical protein K8S62_08920 [Candidatus Sabulitectum sp.]|nr:hypothetical protein [Candidatus Sabulitectum sp.]